ncbi:epithelial membrane protein 2-like [Callorhinchus milii]|uniref:Epithelial membrane protein 2-like protein n=1 Tax=Callorhinchus milii TaxID=7868 RepID=V9L9N5_CALMI|nr:epithelial membrane protein 2-like [Callorhinchus milii]
MLWLLLSIFLLHLTTVILLFIASTNTLWVTGDIRSRGLWRQCFTDGNCSSLTSGYSQHDTQQVVQAAMILAVIFTCLSLLIFLCQLFTLKKGQRFIVTGIFQLISCLCVMIGVTVFTKCFPPDVNQWFSSGYILAWISFVLTLASSSMYFILRKRE